MAEADGPRGSAGASAASGKIVVVGPCAAGKSTLVAALRALGYDAHVSGQEHSEIATLWQRSQPDVLIALDVDITAVRDRRGGPWPEWLHDLQVRHIDQCRDSRRARRRLSGSASCALTVNWS